MKREDDWDSDRLLGSGDESYQHVFDFDAIPPSRAVLQIVGAVTDTSPMKLDPLSECIDPGALDDVVASVPEEPDSGVFLLEFRYYQHAITIRKNGKVEVRPLPGEAD